jgi:murein DD-endopeptidase MepM/ murein hydrolase activator NlpD
MSSDAKLKRELALKFLFVKYTVRLTMLRIRRRVEHLLDRFLSRKKRLLFVTKLVGISVAIICTLSMVPAPSVDVSEDIPFFGNFAWYTDSPARLSAGDFREQGRGGTEDYIPKLRLMEYTIQRGDTLWSISKKFDVDPDSLISCNVFSNVHAIHEGDVILIPNIRGIFMNVSEGDTIFEYSTTYRIAPDFIMEVNELSTNQLHPGMKLFLPGVRFNNMERAYALGEAFSKPLRGRLTSRYGYRRDPFTGKRAFHRGIDIANRVGSRVHAAQGGRILFTGARSGYGNVVIIEHQFGYKTLYAHLDAVEVSKGQLVKSGQIIGKVGNSGRSTGPHVHFEIWLKNRTIDPLTQTNMAVR